MSTDLKENMTGFHARVIAKIRNLHSEIAYTQNTLNEMIHKREQLNVLLNIIPLQDKITAKEDEVLTQLIEL